MAQPTNKTEFTAYVKRLLGDGAICLNVTDEQIEDRICEAIKFYQDYHFDGSMHTYYKVQVTDQMKSDKYIDLPDNIFGAIRIFNIGSVMTSNNMFNARYQWALSDMHTFQGGSIVPYFMNQQHLELIEQLLVGEKPIRYNRHQNRIHIDMDWDVLATGEYLIVDAYEVVDPDTYTRMWSDYYLQRLAAALIKKQWGFNLLKFNSMPLPGGVQFNGLEIYQQADQEVRDLEQKMQDSYSLPPMDMIG